MGKHWNAIMCLMFWPIAANLGNGSWYWQWTQGPRHDYHFGIIHSWQPVSCVSPVLLNKLVFVSVMANANSGFLSGKCLPSLLSSSPSPARLCLVLILSFSLPVSLPLLAPLVLPPFAPTKALQDGGYLTWHRVSTALFTHGLRHIRTVFVAEMNQQSNCVIQPGVKMVQVCPVCLFLQFK